MKIKSAIFIMVIICLSMASYSFAESPNKLNKIQSAPTVIDCSVWNYTVKTGGTIRVDGRLSKVDGISYLPYRYLDFCIYDAKGTQLAHQEAITNGYDGWAIVNIKPVEWKLSPGHYQLKIKYAGNTDILPYLEPTETKFKSFDVV